MNEMNFTIGMREAFQMHIPITCIVNAGATEGHGEWK